MGNLVIILELLCTTQSEFLFSLGRWVWGGRAHCWRQLLCEGEDQAGWSGQQPSDERVPCAEGKRASPLLVMMMMMIAFYIALFSALEQTDCARMWFYMSDKLFYSVFLNIHRSGVLTALAWLVPRETAAVSAQVQCTPCSMFFFLKEPKKFEQWCYCCFYLLQTNRFLSVKLIGEQSITWLDTKLIYFLENPRASRFLNDATSCTLS